MAALALTVNPARDTPTRVRAFLRRRHALAIDFLLGTAKQLRPIWKAFHVVSAAETGNADVHSSDARVYDRSGVWVSTLHLPVDLTPANLVHDIRTALAQPVSAQAAVTIAALMMGGYKVRSIDLIDLFPQTFHIETIAHLSIS